MRSRREEVEAKLKSDEILVSMSVFPRLGCGEKTFYPPVKADPVHSFTRSLFWPNEGTFQGHPRFRTLTRNIRERRGEKVRMTANIQSLKNNCFLIHSADPQSRVVVITVFTHVVRPSVRPSPLFKCEWLLVDCGSGLA